ncbi:branched-chain amino acid transport system permease protein [Paucibacter oligotrophus]|uniref:Branched-chain amino acid transport system permease protein n=1 Tax=Roseateles oligotrophus TaxID=1769250 RepID=A0A840LKK0_9BURK|nr:branched-chain amino acid transport system permease protein [Roseateles oligotrophus]
MLALPFALQGLGTHWVRTADMVLLYTVLALGMNIIVGCAGLLDLGYVAFYAVGAYSTALLSSPHLAENFAWVLATFPAGLHASWWITLPLAAALAAFFGMLLGSPTLKLRGDYLAMVTLGFGEIVRLLINNLGHPINLSNGAQGIGPIDPFSIFGLSLGQRLAFGAVELEPVSLYYYLLLALLLLTLLICHRLQGSRLGRAWMAIRDDEMAASAMGIDIGRMKLLAFGIGASFAGMAGSMFAAIQGHISPEAFSLQESVIIVAMVVFGGIGHIRGVILGAALLSALPELLRYVVGPLQTLTDGRLDAGIMRPLLISLAMILTMLWRPHGLWPAADRGRH